MTVATQQPANVEPIAGATLGRIGMADILFDPARFQQVQRVASMLQHSPLVPDHIRGKSKEEGMANIILAFALAVEMGENPLVVMQNIYFVHGRAGWFTQYMIAKAARAGVFRGPIRWKSTGSGKSLAVTAQADLAATGETVETTVDMTMAEAEGWTTKAGSKYKTMPEHMLKWRSAAFLIRLYAPQVMLGYQTADELEDLGGPTPAPPSIHPAYTLVVEATEAEKVAPSVEKPEPAPRRTKSRAAATEEKALDYLDPAHKTGLNLINQGTQEGWLTDAAAGGISDQLNEQRKNADLAGIQATVRKLEALRDAPPVREAGWEG